MCLDQVKVLWSKEKETAEQEAERKAEAARRKEEKRAKLARLVKFSKDCRQRQAGEVVKRPQNSVD